MTVASPNMFADLVPAASHQVPPAVASSTALVPLAQRGPHPVLANYHTPDGHLDTAAFSAAMNNWMHVPAAVPPPATAAGGTTPAPGTPAPAPGTPPAPAPAPGTPPGSSPANALAAWNTFYNSPTYQVPLAQGLDAVNTKYAAMGALESGAAMKAISDYSAGQASAGLSTYMNDLYRQEALGESAAAATAGVGTNMVGQVTANNNAAASATGNAAMTAGSAAGNAALVAGNGAANTWNTVGSSIGQVAGTVAGAMGSSYHPANALAPTSNFSSPTGNYIYGGNTGWTG